MRTVSLILAGLAAWAPAALAQSWQAYALHPAGYLYSQVNAITPERQYGEVQSHVVFPAVWSGSASSFSILGGAPGLVLGVAPGQVVGLGPGGGAAVWEGDPPTLVSLHNPAWYYSQANATSGQEQVGYFQTAPGQPPGP